MGEELAATRFDWNKTSIFLLLPDWLTPLIFPLVDFVCNSSLWKILRLNKRNSYKTSLGIGECWCYELSHNKTNMCACFAFVFNLSLYSSKSFSVVANIFLRSLGGKWIVRSDENVTFTTLKKFNWLWPTKGFENDWIFPFDLIISKSSLLSNSRFLQHLKMAQMRQKIPL